MLDNKRITKIENKQSGFTLIEVMIVVVIISILAAVAVPSYQNYILRSKRADATNKLTDIANQQIQYFIDNRVYGTVADLNLPTTNAQGQGTTNCTGDAISEDGYYCIKIDDTPSRYTLIATVQGSQEADMDCWTIQYDSSETKSSKRNTGTKASPVLVTNTSSDKKKCWGN